MSYRLWIFFDPCTTLLDSIGKFSISTCPTERRKTEREEKEAAVKTENLGGGVEVLEPNYKNRKKAWPSVFILVLV
jgi:hypothetical protein